MTTERSLIERNAKFASDFGYADLEIQPRMSTLIVACVDSRVDPAHILGLDVGDAFVMRNVGGRVTDQVIEQVKILHTLGSTMMGINMDVAVIHHTGCGASMFAMPQLAEALNEALESDGSVIESLAITDPVDSVRIDIERLRAANILSDEMPVAGYVYDVNSGQLQEVVAQAPLRSLTTESY